ncbi:acetylxylan esterase [Spirochaetia bacterium]|nr:acetylxylan esterase [Spirochaetia bacterium]
MFKEKIDELNLPSLLVTKAAEWQTRREEILSLLQKEMYGFTPPPCPVHGKVLREDMNAYSGKAVERKIELVLDAPGGSFSFPVTITIPKEKKLAVFVNIAFMITGKDDQRYCPSCPVEEIIDGGFVHAIFDYLSVASDDGDFSSGLAAVFPRSPGAGWGKLGMWAYAMSRVADYLKTLEEFASLPLAAIGFSRLGKTSLWCGAQDERFDFVMPFGSSTAGIAFTRKNSKQSMEELQHHHSHWFCENFRAYNNNENAMPFDQHFPLALCAPRRLLTSIAEEDEWVDVEKEYLSCKAAGVVWELFGKKDFTAPDNFPHAPCAFWQGNPAMSLRHGTHFFSRADWQAAMAYIKGGTHAD